jgi:putative endonuclease
MYSVYILENPQGRFYIGQTDDLPRRLSEHNHPDRARTRYSGKHGPWTLVWSEDHPTRASAMARERFIKSRKSARWIRHHLLGGASPDVHRD